MPKLGKHDLRPRSDAQVLAAAEQDADNLPLRSDQLKRLARSVPAPDVKTIRTSTGLSQSQFALRFGFDVSALRDWEQGRRTPDRAARVLLTMVKYEPQAVERALANMARSHVRRRESS